MQTTPTGFQGSHFLGQAARLWYSFLCAVLAALQDGGTMEQAMHQLLSQSELNSSVAANNNPESEPNPTSSADYNANSSIPILPDAGGPSTASELEDRDAEMEDELAEELAKGDALTDYDIEVGKEGESITEYLALLESADNSEKASCW